MGILLMRLIDILNEYEEGSTFYSIAYTLFLHFDEIQSMSIQEVANMCHVSKSTISKFVRAIHFEDYNDFKNEAEFKENRFLNPHNYNDNIIQYILSHNKQDYIQNIIQDFQALAFINMDTIKEIASMIYQYPVICTFGTLFSQLGALDLQYKLAYNHKFIMSFTNDVKQDEYLKNNKDEGVIIIYSNSGHYLDRYQVSSFQEKKSYQFKNKKVILITSNQEMLNHPQVDICLLYQHTTDIQTHNYIYPLINDFIVSEYRKFLNCEL